MKQKSRPFTLVLGALFSAVPALAGEETLRLTDAPGHDMVATQLRYMSQPRLHHHERAGPGPRWMGKDDPKDD